MAGEGRVALAGAARLELVTGARQLPTQGGVFGDLGYLTPPVRVTEKRARQAVQRLFAHQVDATGKPTWRQGQAVLDAARTRMRVGQVAVPYGACTEPANVQAGGGACPLRFRCVGCGHFRTDASYLPELQTYHDRLLTDREIVLAATELDVWARSDALPSQAETDKVSALISAVRADVDNLDETARAELDEACRVVRKTRQTVDLGLPRLRAVHGDPRAVARTE